MKSFIATLALFAAVANAAAPHHPRSLSRGKGKGPGKNNVTLEDALSQVNGASSPSSETTLVTLTTSSTASVASVSAAVISDPAENPDASPSPIIIDLPVTSDAAARLNNTEPARFGNATTAAGPLTTLTVEVTETETVTSCAKTIKNCPTKTEDLATLPPDALVTVIVTKTKSLTEIVCPVTDAPSISKDIVDKHRTRTRRPQVTSSARPQRPEDEEEDCETSTKVTKVATRKTITKTVGGNNGRPTVVTETVQEIVDSTIFVTITKGNGGKGNGGNGGHKDEPTTTVVLTSTTVKAVTVPRPEATNGNSPVGGNHGGGNVGGNSPIGGGHEQCNCPAAVTVTLPAHTVFVTLSEKPSAATDKPKGNGGNKGNAGGKNKGNGKKHNGKGKGKGKNTKPGGAKPTGDEVCDAEVTSTVTSKTTVTAAAQTPSGSSSSVSAAATPSPSGKGKGNEGKGNDGKGNGKGKGKDKDSESDDKEDKPTPAAGGAKVVGSLTIEPIPTNQLV